MLHLVLNTIFCLYISVLQQEVTTNRGDNSHVNWYHCQHFYYKHYHHFWILLFFTMTKYFLAFLITVSGRPH